MKNLLTKIGISQAGHFEKDGSFVIDFENDSDYNKAFSRLDRTELVEENPEASSISLDASIVVYQNDEYILQLVANFDNNSYQLRVKEVEN